MGMHERHMAGTWKGTHRLTRRGLIGLLAGGLTSMGSIAGSASHRDMPSPGTEEGDGEVAPERRDLVEHVMGETEVPVNPQRVVVVDYRTTLITAMDLNVPVVGAVTPSDGSFPLLTNQESAGIENIGAFPQPNLEKIALLKPDLIVGWRTGMENAYGELSQIAPTVALEPGFQDWKAAVREAATVFGKESEIAKQIAAFEERAEQFRRQNEDRLTETEVSLVRIDTDLPRVYTEHHYNGAVLKEAGVQRPEKQRIEDPEVTNYDVSLEQMPELDGDVLFYFVGGGKREQEEAEQSLERLRSNPLWNRLRAVQNNRSYRVDAAHWFEGVSVRGANLILDDLEKYLVEAQ